MEEDERMARDLQAVESSSYDSESSDSSSFEDEPIPGLNNINQTEHNFDADFYPEPQFRAPFSRDTFKRLIQKTYEDYYPSMYNLSEFKIDEYMQLVAEEQLEAKFGVYLENAPENIINMQTMPWLDIGDLPSSYSKNKPECYQVYVVPQNRLPSPDEENAERSVLYIEWESFRRGFDKREPLELLKQSNFVDYNGLQPQDLEDTIDKATELLTPYRGWISNIEWIKNGSLILSGIIMFAVSVLVGLNNDDPFLGALIGLLWTIVCILAVYYVKRLYTLRLRQSNFLLAVFCRAENNRHYLRLGIELRPGFLGKWIEVSQVDLNFDFENIQRSHSDVVAMMRYRFLKPANQLRVIDHEMSMKQAMRDQQFMRNQRKIEEQIQKRKTNQQQQQIEIEMQEVAAARLASDPAEYSQSDLHRPSNVSMHSNNDMMLSSAVKLASETSLRDISTNQLVPKKKKKKVKKKKQGSPKSPQQSKMEVD